MAKYLIISAAIFSCISIPLQAEVWTETSQGDFVDGSFNANVFTSTIGLLSAQQDAFYDLDEDGNPDIIVCNMHDSYDFDTPSFIYWGSDSGYSDADRTSLSTIGATCNSVADLNDDGYLDIVFSSYTTEPNTNSSIYWGSSTGYSDGDVTYLPTLGSHGNYIADLNDDGYFDIVFANYGSGSYHEVPSYIYWGSSEGYSTANRSELTTIGGICCSVADLNGDGYLDIVFSNRQSSDPDWNLDSYIYWGSASGYSPTNRTDLPTHGAYGNSIADLNDDGYLDIFFCNLYNGSTYLCNSYIYWGSAGGFSSDNKTELPTIGANSASIADLNKDGCLDIAIANWHDGTTFDVNSFIYWGSITGFSETNRTELPTYAATGTMIGKLSNSNAVGCDYLDVVFTGNGETYLYFGSEQGYSPSDMVTLPCTYGHLSTKNIGNIHDRSELEYYQSSVFDAGAATDWGTVSWSAEMPDSSAMVISVRTGNTPNPDVSWSSWQEVGNGSAIPENLNNRYIQYCSASTRNKLLELPSLDNISITYAPLGIVEGSFQRRDIGSDLLTKAKPNPFTSMITIEYRLKENRSVSLKIFDEAGKLVKTLQSGLAHAGIQTAVWDGTDSNSEGVETGVYFVRLATPDYHVLKKILFIR